MNQNTNNQQDGNEVNDDWKQDFGKKFGFIDNKFTEREMWIIDNVVNKSNAINEPIKDEELLQSIINNISNESGDEAGDCLYSEKECIKIAKQYAASKLNNSSAETVIKNCLEAARWNMEHANVAPEYQQDFYNINANAICDCEEFLESKLNNSVEDKPELTGLICKVNDKDYVVTSATRTTNNSIIFHLSGEKDSLQLKIKQ